MWIIGGDVNQGHYHVDVWNSADGKNWTLTITRQARPVGAAVLHYTLVLQRQDLGHGGQTMPQFAPAAGGILPRHLDHRRRHRVDDAVTRRSRSGRARGHDRRRRCLQGPHVGSRAAAPTTRRKTPSASSTTMSGAGRRHRAGTGTSSTRPWAAAAVPRRRRLRRSPVGPRGLRGPANRNDVWHSADGVRWYELPATPWRSAPCRQRLRPRPRPLDGRRQQHGARCLEARASGTATVDPEKAPRSRERSRRAGGSRSTRTTSARRIAGSIRARSLGVVPGRGPPGLGYL